MTYSERIPIVFSLVGLLTGCVASAAGAEFTLKVSAGDHDRVGVPARCAVTVPDDLAGARLVRLVDDRGHEIPGQLTLPGLTDRSGEVAGSSVQRQLHFVVPKLEAGKSLELTATITADQPPRDESFAWTDAPGKYTELSYDGRPVLRYMYAALDESSSARRMETYKPYHHVYDPQGQRYVTKGAGGLFPHHRGLFYGFNRISYDGGEKRADTWHCNRGEFQSHEQFLASEAGPVLGRHRLAIHWHGQDGQTFATEEREMGVYHVPGGLLIEFASRLQSTVGAVKLDGDPQHAGFQFRGSQEIPDKTKQLTYYLRPDGKDKSGSFRNWPADKQHANLPWNAMSFVLGDQRYTCCYLDHPGNPKEARFSERDYGRFGSYFEYDLTADNPLELNYRVWLQEGEMTVSQVQAHSDDFVHPLAVVVQ